MEHIEITYRRPPNYAARIRRISNVAWYQNKLKACRQELADYFYEEMCGEKMNPFVGGQLAAQILDAQDSLRRIPADNVLDRMHREIDLAKEKAKLRYTGRAEV